MFLCPFVLSAEPKREVNISTLSLCSSVAFAKQTCPLVPQELASIFSPYPSLPLSRLRSKHVAVSRTSEASALSPVLSAHMP
jgi:hypothetical protein